MELPKRKKLRLNGYDYSSNGAYFVTICVQNRSKILSGIVGDGSSVPHIELSNYGILVENQIRSIDRKYTNVKIDRYVIMPNHVHMIMSIENAEHRTGDNVPTVGSIIAWFKYQITKQINNAEGNGSDQIWQRSYYDHIIRNEQDYQMIWQYIDTNPMKLIEDCFYQE